MKHFLLILMLLLIVQSACAESDAGAFILGVDVSELLSQESCWVTYYDFSGEKADALAVLAASGISHVRLRVWNDPFDEQGRGYGAGNINAERAAKLSARAARLSMKTLIDFHYSDFWADPSRQIAPKAWAGKSLSYKEAALAAYTREALALILDAGGDVDMVQVGNETNYGMAGEYELEDMARLIAAGCHAVRQTAEDRGRSIRVCVHLADPQDTDRLFCVLRALEEQGADYDIVGLSYYPYWHGSLENLKGVIESVRRDFGRDVFIAETAWPFTLEDGDGADNVIGYDPGRYPVSPEGQAQAFEEVCRTASEAGALGVFYWGGIWTPVGPNAKENWPVWETQGSGWATRFASAYDPEHVGDTYGGCAWDNQAMFDFSGHPLPVLETARRLAEEKSRFPLTERLEAVEERNLVLNPSFEEEDRSVWEAVSDTDDIPFDYLDFVNDAHTGTVAFHYWSEQDMSFSIRQTLTGLEPGWYAASVWSQGGDMTDASLTLFAIADGRYYETPFMNTTWADWQHPAIGDIPVTQGSMTIGVKIRCGSKSWGTLDDFSVVKQ